MAFELYTRVQGNVDDPWVLVGTSTESGGVYSAPTMEVSVPDQVEGESKKIRGASVVKNLGERDYHYINEPYQPGGLHCGLNDENNEIYEYAIHVTRIGTNTTRSTFSQLVTGYVTFVTGASSNLNNLANNSTIPYETVMSNQMAGITNISNPENYSMKVQFSDGLAPQLVNKTPLFTPTDSGVTMTLQLDRVGDAYYVLAPLDDSGAAALAPMIGTVNVDADKLKLIATGGEGLLVKVNADGSLTDEVAPPDITQPGTGPDGTKYAYNGKTLTTNSEEPYYFNRPNSLEIYNPRGSGLTSPMLVTGSKTDLGTSRTPIEIDGLAPNTTYYVYLVTKGVSDVRSEVMVYQFKTKPITRPVITLEHNQATAIIGSNIDANVEYKLIPYNSTTMDSRLKVPFSTVANQAFTDDKMADKSSSKVGPNNTPIKYGDKEFTVLDALLENVSDTDGRSLGSFFDLYATAEEKNIIADYIRSTTTTGTDAVGRDSATVEAGKTVNVVCGGPGGKWELSNIEYCMLAFGWSGSGDTASGNAFRATRPIQLGDTTWLHINQMFEDLRYDDAKKSVTGTLTLNFDDDLYYLDNSTNPPELISLDITPMGTHGQTDKFQSVANYIQHAPEISLSIDASKKDRLVRELTFTFTGASARSYIRFDMNLSDASQNVHKQYQLMVQLNVDPDTGKVDVNITPEWDGRVLPE